MPRKGELVFVGWATDLKLFRVDEVTHYPSPTSLPADMAVVIVSVAPVSERDSVKGS